jgi:hypothetical protein
MTSLMVKFNLRSEKLRAPPEVVALFPRKIDVLRREMRRWR